MRQRMRFLLGTSRTTEVKTLTQPQCATNIHTHKQTPTHVHTLGALGVADVWPGSIKMCATPAFFGLNYELIIYN